MSVKQYLEKLAQDGGFDEATKQAFLKVLANDAQLKPLEDGFLRQEDYSRNMDALTRSKAEFETLQNTWRDWYKEATTRDAQREEELQSLRAKVNGTGGGAGGGTGGGGNNGGGSGGGAGAPTLTKKELDERDGRLILIMKQGMRLASRHAAEFHEALDTDALEKIAIEKGLTLDRAYEEFVRPRVEAAQKLATEAAIKKAHDDGVTEGLSKRDIPSEGDRGFHPLFRSKPADGAQDPTKLSDRQRSDNFATAWATEAAKK